MKSLFARVVAGAALTTMTPSLIHAQAAAAPPAQPDAETDNDTDIVVTATKRAERLRDVPAAITVINNETITRAGIQDFRDYASLVPGLSQRDLGAPGVGTIILRGLNTGSQQTTNTAGFYLDDAAVSSSGYLGVGALFTPNPDLGDVDRIEVLKGPQGTLFGANSLGGLVRIVSRPPDSHVLSGSVRGEASATAGGDMGYSGRGAVNVPLVDGVLAIRASGAYRRIGGFADNVGTGDENVNRSNIYGGRLALRASPMDGLTIDLVSFLQNTDSVGIAGQDNVSATLRPLYRRYAYNTFANLDYRVRNRTL